MGGDDQKAKNTLLTDLERDDIDSKDFIFDTKSCPIGCECMANLADCGEKSMHIFNTSLRLGNNIIT